MSACAPARDRLVSSPFRLEPHQIARLTVRHTFFCAGGESLHVALAFANSQGRTVAKKEAILGCGGSAQLDLARDEAPKERLTARLDYWPRPAHAPQAAVEVITTAGPRAETSVVYLLRMRFRGTPKGCGSTRGRLFGSGDQSCGLVIYVRKGQFNGATNTSSS